METVDLVAALRRPAAYPAPPSAEIEVVETHISVLFFADDRVYKVKKAITLDFLDYATIDRRRHFCEEEVRLNQALAPGVYLGVVPITRTPEGVIAVAGAGATVEYAVEMVRLPADRMMSVVLDRGEIDNGMIDAIAQRLARFHGAAATGPGVDEFGDPAEVGRQLEENFSELRVFADAPDPTEPPAGPPSDPAATLSGALLGHLDAAGRGWLAANRDRLGRRVREGRIREGHGDLHCDNICLTRDAIVIYDRIEFTPRFRCRDVACDMAFLAMDLDLRCFRGFADYLLRRYAEATADPELAEIAGFYKLHLAAVRGKVASLRAADPGLPPAARTDARREAMRYFHLAAAYTLPPALILMCGLPGSGKSHAARSIARPFEAAVLRSDVVRKQLAGIAPTTRGESDVDAGLYAPDATRRTYAALLDHAVEQVRKGRTVIVDAAFPTASRRAPFFAAAQAGGFECVLVETTCDEGVIRSRLATRADDTTEVSDADWKIYEIARDRFEAPVEIDETRRVSVDTEVDEEDVVRTVIERLLVR